MFAYENGSTYRANLQASGYYLECLSGRTRAAWRFVVGMLMLSSTSNRSILQITIFSVRYVRLSFGRRSVRRLASLTTA